MVTRNVHYSYYLIISNLMINVVSQTPTQYEICKVTRSGTEYKGKISETTSGYVCDYWESSSTSESVKRITDYDFPDGSRRAARNFCRNPNNSPFGPWCYTKIESEEKDNCTVPLCCNMENCKTTGPGMEYTGGIQRSVYDNECLHWAATSKTDEIDSNMLPEGNIMLAGKSCRNPTGAVSGPWCYVLAGETTYEDNQEESWIKEPCDVPTCFSLRFITVIQRDQSENNIDNYYTHFSSINSELGEINFSIKLWNPEEWQNGEIKLAVCLLPVPVNGQQLREWDIGYEVIIRNVKGGVTPSREEEQSWEDHPGLLSGTQWSLLKLSWNNGFISLTGQSKEKTYFIHEVKLKENGILTKENTPMKYISLAGTTAFWNFSHEENYCEQHIITGMQISRYWPLSTVSLNKFLGFHVRSESECIIEFRISPAKKYPCVQLSIQDESGRNVIMLKKAANDTVVLSSTILGISLSYWKWNELSISISGYRFNMLITTKNGLKTVFDLNNEIFQAIKWYGFASSGTSHWTQFCKPSQEEYEAMPPECSVSKLDMEYEGLQWVTQAGLPCLPWVANLQNGLENNQFPDGSIAAALNYCRNPTADPHGAYCIAINISSEISILKQSCNIRKCKFKDCRIAGTANDFMGQISTTLSGRQCQHWERNNPHVVDKYILHDELYPERSVKSASNYCRDPSNSMGGPWCYTLDLEVEKDLCDVPDCYKATACTIIIRLATNKRVFIVPQWRAYGLPLWIKMWNPNVSTTLVMNFYPKDQKYKYQLLLGDNENEQIKLYHISESGDATLLKQKMSQHFLSSGRWVGIVISLKGDEINIRYNEKIDPFFIWKKGVEEYFPNADAMYFSYEARSKDDEGSLGLNFPCDVCQTEICIQEFSHFSAYYPTNVWMENASLHRNNLTFYLRGSGVFTVNLYVLPSKFPSGALNINDGSFGDLMEIQLVHRKYLNRVAAKHKGSPAFVKDYWSEISLVMGDDKNGSLLLNGTTFLTWTYPRLPLFYYFNVQCKEIVTWVINCPPPQLDGTPVNGGWSPWSNWQCSASCGGGRGTRQRMCNHPEPSMFGRTCEGQSTDMGICNENPCGEVTITTINLIREHLAQRSNNIQIYVNEPVEMLCNKKLLELIKEESPKSTIHWNRNGIKITENIIIGDVNQDFKMVITTANISDSGVYACIMIKPGEDREVVDIFALTVKSKGFTKRRRVGQKLFLKANSILLSSVYSNLRLSWLLKGNIYKEYDVSDIRLIEEETIYPVKRIHEGVWISSIYQTELRLNWTTSWYNVQVKRRANWATYLLEEDLLKGKLGTNEILIYVAITVIFLIVIVATTAFTIFIIRLIRYFTKNI